MFYNPFLYGIIDWIFKNILVRNGRVRWVHNGGRRSKRIYVYDVGGEVKFLPFCAHVLI